MFPYFYKNLPALGMSFKNQVNLYSIDTKNMHLRQFKIEKSYKKQDNFIKCV